MNRRAGFFLPAVLVVLAAWITLAAAGTAGVRVLAHLQTSTRAALGRQMLLEETTERIKDEWAVRLPAPREEECERDGRRYRVQVRREYRTGEAPVWVYRIEVEDDRERNGVTLWLPAQGKE